MIANILWGVNTPLIKMGVESIPAPFFMSIRFLIASLIMLPFALRDWKPLKYKDFLLLILSSVFYISLSSLALNVGLSMTTAFNTAIIWLLAPLLLFILSASYLKEGLSLKTFIGIIVALAGSLVIIGKPWEGGGATELTGNLLIVTAVFCTTVSTLICKPLTKKTGSYQLTFMNLFPGIVPIVIYAAFFGTWDIDATTTTSLYGLIASTVVIIIANFLFFYALRHKKAQSTGVYQYLDPLAAIVAAWFLLAERPSPTFALGAGLVIVGVYITEMHASKKRKQIRR